MKNIIITEDQLNNLVFKIKDRVNENEQEG